MNIAQFRQTELLEAQKEDTSASFYDVTEVMTTKKSELNRASERSVCILGMSFVQH